MSHDPASTSPTPTPSAAAPADSGPAPSTLVHVEVQWEPIQTGEVAHIVMNRPERRNALSLEHMVDLIAAFELVAATDAVGIILSGRGPAFCSGHDFADMRGASHTEIRDLLDTCSELMLLMQQVPQVVMAKVHGIATAAGCQLVASADLAVATESASFAAPGGRGGWFCHTPMVGISRVVSRKRAMEIGLTGDAIDAATAVEWGLINYAVPEENLDDVALDFMRRATRGSRFSKMMGKQTLYRHLDLSLVEAYRYATEVMAATSLSHDAQEGMASFVEKRPARWEHR